MKKLLIFVLAVVMLLSALPFAAFAADDGDTSGDEDTEYEYHDEKISTHYGPVDYGKDWKDYKSYIFYEGNESGYSIDTVRIIVTEDFIAEGKTLDPSYFPKFESKIDRIKYTEYGKEREHIIYLNWEYSRDDRSWPIYTEEMIDEYISILRYLSSFSFIETIYLSHGGIAYTGPIPSGDISDVWENDYKINYGYDDWRYYDEYYYYNYTGDRDYGILADCVLIDLTDEFMETGEEITAEWFPEIEDEIIKVKLLYSINSCTIVLEERNETGIDPVYTEEYIDHYVSILRYVSTFSFVKRVWTNYLSTMYIPEPIEPDPSDTETTEPETTEPVATEPTTTEPETTEEMGAVTENGDNGENELNNPQTGDMFFVYLSVLLLSTGVISVIAAVIMKRKLNR